MKKILCPTDFSASAENAVSYAAKLAQRTGASVHLLHCDLLSDLSPEEIIFGAGPDSDQLRQLLKEECREVSSVFKIACHDEPVASGASLSNHVATLENDYDLIVMGTNGEDEPLQKFFGSATYGVIRKTNAPLMVIPHGCRFTRIDNIAYAFDYWRINDVPMQKIAALCQDLGAQLTVVQVMEAYSHEAEKELQSSQKILKENYSQLAMRFEVLYSDDVKSALHEFLGTKNPEVLAMCFRRYRLSILPPGGLVRQMSREISCPLLVVHEDLL